jgi:hypothetical protein
MGNAGNRVGGSGKGEGGEKKGEEREGGSKLSEAEAAVQGNRIFTMDQPEFIAFLDHQAYTRSLKPDRQTHADRHRRDTRERRERRGERGTRVQGVPRRARDLNHLKPEY